MAAPSPNKDLYLQYYDSLIAERLGPALRTASFFVIGLNLFFLLLDAWVYPDRFQILLVVRLGWAAMMLVIIASIQRFDALLCTKVACGITGLALISLSGIGGGISSLYWPALMVLFLGMPVMMPLTARDSAGIVIMLSLVFAGLPIVTGEGVDARSASVPIFFVVAAAIECVASAKVLDRMRFADFLQRREIEEARDHLRQLDQAKSRFTANIHHELRTPLTLMLAPLESIMGGDFGPVAKQQREYLETMHVNALRLLKLINNLLDLAKIESHQLEICRRPVSLADLATDITIGARPMAERKEITLRLGEFPEGPLVNADRDAMEKVVVNLLGNALKFTEAGGRIEISGRVEAGGVHMSVADTGVGLAPRDLERIFDRFAQADGSATRRHEGTGIGLSLSKELVELHGGRIWAESAGLGRGTTIHVWIPEGEEDAVLEEALSDGPPAHAVSDGLAALSAEVEVSSGDDLRLAELERNVDRWVKTRGERADEAFEAGEAPEIVVCEDNPDMRKLLGHVLSAEFNVRLAANGRLGLEAVRERAPDLVLTDVMMPEMSGTDLCRALKSDPETASIPVVLVTSKAEREMKIEGLELGADDYVTKPFHSRELLARVRSLVRLRQLQAELADRNLVLERTNTELAQALNDLKGAEAQLVLTERLAAVGELAAGIAHEANNPVNFAVNAVRALRGYVEDLRSISAEIAALEGSQGETALAELQKLRERMAAIGFDGMPEAVVELAGIIEEGLSRTGRLVGDLRDFAAPRKGQRARIDLVRTLESSRQLLRHSLQAQNVSVEVAAPEALPWVLADPQALGQVFLNILKNAGEALETNGGHVWVEFSPVDGGVRVEIRDDGPGIAEADMGKLFEPFFTTKEPGRGTGLGLSISHKVIREHGGKIEAHSEQGAGTRFSIWLPAETSDEA
jgi:signal transduction histidine kinase